jgi:hypothetical protein
MALKKDKAKILDEVWTEDRIRGFLDIEPPTGVDRDFHALLKAYQQMRADDFKVFIDMFKAAGRGIDARNPAGQSLLAIIRAHRNSGEFVDILLAAGADTRE